MERMIESLSICLAILGRISEIWTPGAFVAIGLKPLLPFTSQVSRWLIPPSSHSKMTAFALGDAAPAKVRDHRRKLIDRPFKLLGVHKRLRLADLHAEAAAEAARIEARFSDAELEVLIRAKGLAAGA